MMPYMASPSVMECATVKAVACQSTGLRRGSSKYRLIMNKMWSKPRGRMWVKPSCKYAQ